MTSVIRDPAVTPWALTRDQFDRLVELGEFEGEHVELIEGALVELTPQGSEHSGVIALLCDEFVAALRARHGRRYLVRPQLPLAVSARSQPEPDLAVVERSVASLAEHPSTACLVVEVAASSQRIDLVHKVALYAEAGVPEYWVIDLVAREVVVHRDPLPAPEGLEADGARYGSIERLGFEAGIRVLDVSVTIADLMRD